MNQVLLLRLNAESDDSNFLQNSGPIIQYLMNWTIGHRPVLNFKDWIHNLKEEKTRYFFLARKGIWYD